MTRCDNCGKYPLEFREINKVVKGDREVSLCDNCIQEFMNKEAFEQLEVI